jgi:carbonic anhydrase/acetyltransferase-like protein (isoleucine patch superfamily)
VIARLWHMWWRWRLELETHGRAQIAATVRLRTRVIFRGAGALRIGEHAVLGDREAGMPQVGIYLSPRRHEARIDIGAGARVANGVEMIARERIEIGERALIGCGVRILDSDFHGVAPGERGRVGRTSPVRIGNEAWIGASAIVLKGVAIGDGAAVGAGAVVVRDVAAGAVVSGNPARLLAMYVGV